MSVNINCVCMVKSNNIKRVRSIKTLKNKHKSFRKSRLITFSSYPKKKIEKKYIDNFWTKYFNGTLLKKVNSRKDESII